MSIFTHHNRGTLARLVAPGSASLILGVALSVAGGGLSAQAPAFPLCPDGFVLATIGSGPGCTNDGSRLIKLNATNVESGTLADARLSGDVARYTTQNPTWNPGSLTPGTDTTWTFKTGTDNAIATMLISSEGFAYGATPRGYARLIVNAQDEVRLAPGLGPGSTVGSNMNFYLNVMSRTFNNGMCAGTMCPDMAELYSDNHLRFTVAGKGQLTMGRDGRNHLMLDNDGLLKTFTTLYGIGPYGEQSYQLGRLGMEIGGDGRQLYSPPRYAPNDEMSSRRWVDGSLRVGSRVGIGCDVVDSPFGRATEAGEVKDEAGLCVQVRGVTTNLGAYITTPVHRMASEGTALKIDTRQTPNYAGNVGISVTTGNSAEDMNGGATAVKILPLRTPGPDYGLAIDAEGGVEFPLVVRSAGADRLLVCGNGSIAVGLGCSGTIGAGAINIAGDLYRNGVAFRNPDYVFEHAYTGRILQFAENAGAAEYAGLRPLSALEAYTRERNHLPRVAEARGVFERQDALLESLEEAYLYIFQLQKQIDGLNTRISALEPKHR